MDYHQKYLKYKTKYNQLKENQNNQIGGLDFGELRAYFLTEEVFKMCIENQVVKQDIDKICEYINENNTKIKKLKNKNSQSCNVQTTDICTSSTVSVASMVTHVAPTAETTAPAAPTAETTAPVAPTAEISLFHSRFPGVAYVKRRLSERNEKIKAEKSDKIRLECDRLNMQNNKLNEQYEGKKKILYNGTHKRCNFDYYGLDLYATLYGTEKLTFKLQNHAPYCVQGKKELYIPKEKKPIIIGIFNYLIHNNTNNNNFFSLNDLLKLDNFKDKDMKYMVVTRWYRTSPEILICVYIVKKENEEYKFDLIPPGEFYAEEPKKCIVVPPRKKK